MTMIYKAYFNEVVRLHQVLSEISMLGGVFLLRDAYALLDSIASNKVATLMLSDFSLLQLIASDYFYTINQQGWISFDWTEIYFFKGHALEEYQDIYKHLQDEPIKKSDLLYYFKQPCDFWAASIDGYKLWFTSSNSLSVHRSFQLYADQYEEQRDLSFFSLIGNDLLFSTSVTV